MRYMVLLNERPAGLGKLNRKGDPHLFYAYMPHAPACLFDSYEEARNIMRRVQRGRKRAGLTDTTKFRIQSIASGWLP